MSAKPNKPNKDFEDVSIEPDEPVFTTGVVCRLLDIPIWVLKQLDTEAIVRPPREIEGKARLYSIKELGMVKRCWYYMKIHKVKVHGLKIILRMEDGTSDKT